MTKLQKSLYKKSMLLLGMILVIQGCDKTKKVDDNESTYKEIYLDQFKLTYVRQLLLKTYNNTFEVRHLLENDHSGFTEPVLLEYDYHLIDSLTSIDNQKLVKDSASSIGRVAEGAEGKHIIGYLIKKIEDKWLDSLAKARFNIAKTDIQFMEH